MSDGYKPRRFSDREPLDLLENFSDQWVIREEFDPRNNSLLTPLLAYLTRHGYLDSRVNVAAHSMREWAITEKGDNAVIQQCL